MLSEEELTQIQRLSNENPQFDTMVKRINEESKFMLSKVSHEIRNPLTLINSTLQLLESKNPEVLDMKYWKQITSDVNDLILLLDDLSKFNSSEALTLSNTNLLRLITDVKNSFHTEAKKHDITLTLINNLDESYYENYPCDSIKMKQVFLNIIKNAMDAIQDNGFIEIKLDPLEEKEREASKSFIQISISNNGKQISKDELDSIFIPFVTYKTGGTGLGLAIVSKIITAHKGTIEAESNEFLTIFTIKLPVLT